MKDIEVVIKVDECVYETLVDGGYCDYPERVIAQGTPLPKGHGKVGDITELQKIFHNLCDSYGIDNLSFISDMDMNFDLASAIVEADKDCRDCVEWETCECGKIGHEYGTSKGYSIGECPRFKEANKE